MNKTGRLVLIALFSAFLGIISQVMLPSPSGIPLTLQTFAAALCGILLGCASGTLSLAVWLTLGAVGLPVFSGFRGGVAVLFGPTGGFLFGFLFLVLFCGFAGNRSRLQYYFFASVGLIFCHLLGILWFCVVTSQGFLTALLTVSLPYLPKDLLSLAGARLFARGTLQILPFLRKN